MVNWTRQSHCSCAVRQGYRQATRGKVGIGRALMTNSGERDAVLQNMMQIDRVDRFTQAAQNMPESAAFAQCGKCAVLGGRFLRVRAGETVVGRVVRRRGLLFLDPEW